MSDPQIIKKDLAKEYGLDMDDVQELFDAARETVKEYLGHLETDVARKDLESAAKNAHTLKGSLMNMGLEYPGGLAKEVENAAKKSNVQGLLDYLTMLRDDIDPLLN